MADPTKYTPGYNFSGFQTVNPSTPLPGTSVDTELAAIATATEELRDAVMDIRRSDGALKNNSVGPDQLSAALSIGFTNRGTWAEDTAYSAGDGVVFDDTFYSALEAHTSVSGDEPDINPEQWQFLFTIASITTPDGSITPAKLSADAAGFRTKIGVGTLAVEDVEYLDTRVHALDEKTVPADDDEFCLLDSEGLFVGTVFKWASLLAAVQAASGGIPVGGVMDYAGATAPSGWLLCYGQNVSRTTYADLFTAIGTTYGSGDGSTTFKLPDYRGRVLAGKDDMGGTSANRLTGLSGGVNGDNLGATGGLETHTLTTAQLATHSHSVDPPSTTTSSNGSHSHDLGLTNDFGDGNDALVGDGPRDFTTSTGSDGAHTHTVNIAAFTSGSAGSGSAHNNVQPTAIANKIIYAGV